MLPWFIISDVSEPKSSNTYYKITCDQKREKIACLKTQQY